MESVEVPLDALPPDTLLRLIESFILREGTDYGAEEVSLPTRVEQVRRQLQRGEAQILFFLEEENFAIVPVTRSSSKAREATPSSLDSPDT